LPCYNPQPQWAERVVDAVEEIQNHYNNNYKIEVVLINDGSELNEKDLLVLFQSLENYKYVPLAENKGKGNALRVGIAVASGEYTIFTDIDFPYSFESFQKIVSELKEGAELSWAIRDNTYYNQIPLVRKAMSVVLQWCIKTIFNLPIADTQGGLKGFDTKGKALFLKTTIDRYLFDLEFVKMAYKEKMTLKPIIGKLRPGVHSTSMGLSILMSEFRNFLGLMF
jgi:glycosyltransferase involved in cell wall biosynthesis